MSEMKLVESGAVLAAFAGARDEYLKTMRRVPGGASEYLKPGDDYSLGGIAVHVNFVLEHYTNVLNALVAGGFAECRPEDPAGLQERANARAKEALPAAEVAVELATTEELHGHVSELVARITADLDRKTPVWYPGGSEAYPTSAADVLGWLTDHYREHVPQLEALVAAWELGAQGESEAFAVVTRFCEAFDRRDVDAVMALMTDDCVFESTFPAPDGERHTRQAAVRKYWEHFFGTTEDPRFENEEMFSSGDRVVSRWRFSWGGGEAGGHVRGIDVYRVRDGKVAEKLAYVKG
jgi:ketosteroid isomerase-like protein